MRKYKIVRIIDRLNIGGPSIHVALLSSQLDPEKFQTLLLSGQISKDEGSMEYIVAKYQVTPLYIPYLQREISPISDLKCLWQMYQILKQHQPDIVHTHKSKAGFIGRMAAILAGIKVIVHTFHGHVFHGYFSRWKTRLFIQIEKALAIWTHRIIVISEQQKREICGTYRIAPAHRFRVIPLGFDFSRLDQMESHRGWLRKQYHIPEDNVVIGIVGRLASVKNHSMFLQAAQKLLQKHRNISFVIVGDGELRQELQDQAQHLQIDSQIIFTGWIQEPARIYCDLEIVALTSVNEGTPVTLIEAMYCNKPIVSTAVGGVVDIVTEGQQGFLIASNDVENFCDALEKLINTPQTREKMGQQGHQRVQQQYSQQRLVRDIENLYRELL